MILRDLIKTNTQNDGTRSLFESILVPEVNQALIDWKSNFNGKCVLIGGTATGYYSKPRTTTDIDMLFLSPSDIPQTINGFKRTSNGDFQHNKTHVEVEVITPQTINMAPALINKVFETAVQSNGIHIASPSGIVALKLGSMNRFDEGDIWGLIETGKVNLTGWPLSELQLKTFQTILDKVNSQHK